MKWYCQAYSRGYSQKRWPCRVGLMLLLLKGRPVIYAMHTHHRPCTNQNMKKRWLNIMALSRIYLPLKLLGHFFRIFFRASKSFFYLSGPAFPPPPPLLVAGPLKKNFIFAASLSCTYFQLLSTPEHILTVFAWN